MSFINLKNAKDDKNDEFYTQLCDIEKELINYTKYFENKIIYCNCDDPEWSNFYFYFKNNFNNLNLRLLISTHYKKNQQSYMIKFDGKNELKTNLNENGHFKSNECVEILKKCDIVVTNPPFSLFREYIALLEEYNKKYLVIGNYNAVTYKDIFKLVKENKLWIGVSPRSMKFKLPNGTLKGVNACWFTNLEHSKKNKELILSNSYNELDYSKYENYDAIDVSKTSNIPIDYYGYIGVPITFLDKYNPNQFDIIALGITGSIEFTKNEKMIILDKDSNQTKKTTYNAKGTLYKLYNKDKDIKPIFKSLDNDNLYVSLFARIIIKRKGI